MSRRGRWLKEQGNGRGKVPEPQPVFPKGLTTTPARSVDHGLQHQKKEPPAGFTGTFCLDSAAIKYDMSYIYRELGSRIVTILPGDLTGQTR
jgi:hypothetical protein